MQDFFRCKHSPAFETPVTHSSVFRTASFLPSERESKLGYEDVDWEKLMSEGLLRKQKVSILNLYIEHHSLTTEKKLPKKKEA